MTNLTAAAQSPIQMDQFEVSGLLTGTYSDRSTSGFNVDVGSGYFESYTGAGLAFDGSGNLASGTITGLSETYFGANLFTITGMSLDAAQFVSWVHAGNNSAVLNAMFGGNDSIVGSAGDDLLEGLGGHDVLIGGNGADRILGGDGNDHIYGQSATGGPDGADSLSGGDGSDYLQGNAGNDTIDGGAGSDRINGGANDDLITAGIGADTVNGNLGSDTIDGGDGNDFLRGGKDGDSISGGAGDDTMSGDVGNDTIIGGAGLDTLTGATDADLFRFAAGDAGFALTGASAYATDTITDFTHGTDHIGLGFMPAAILTGAAQSSASAAAALAQQLFDGHAGGNEVAAIQVGSDEYLFFSGTGGATIDSAIRAAGVGGVAFGTADFV